MDFFFTVHWIYSVSSVSFPLRLFSPAFHIWEFLHMFGDPGLFFYVYEWGTEMLIETLYVYKQGLSTPDLHWETIREFKCH